MLYPLGSEELESTMPPKRLGEVIVNVSLLLMLGCMELFGGSIYFKSMNSLFFCYSHLVNIQPYSSSLEDQGTLIGK